MAPIQDPAILTADVVERYPQVASLGCRMCLHCRTADDAEVVVAKKPKKGAPMPAMLSDGGMGY